MTYQPRDYQQDAIDATWKYLREQSGNPVIVAPTGSGKSIILAELAKGAYENNVDVLVLAHRKELLEQNRAELDALLGGDLTGTYSSGLNCRDTTKNVIFCGIQSVYKRAHEFGNRRLILVDEPHLIPPGRNGATMYQQFLQDIFRYNPTARLVGTTATPYRLDSGLIYGPEEPFDAVSYEIKIPRLLEAGYLCPIVSRPVQQVDTSKLRRSGNDFASSDMESLFDAHTIAACEELVHIADTENRKHCLIFASGVTHARHIAEIVEQLTGLTVPVIEGATPPLLRSSVLSNFKNGSVRFLVNCDVLTVGFNSKNIDLIGLMRATLSPGLFMQICGRGFRLHPDKQDCLLLDYGGNLERHGPLDSPTFGSLSRPGGSEEGETPMKMCPQCELWIPAGRRNCDCGFQFPPPDVNHESQSDKESPVLMKDVKVQPFREWNVVSIQFLSHTKRNGTEDDPKTLRVIYEVSREDEPGDLDSVQISEWICFEHDPGSRARREAEKWWAKRSFMPCPGTVFDAVEICNNIGIADTPRIRTQQNGKYHEIIAYQLGEIPDPPAPKILKSLFGAEEYTERGVMTWDEYGLEQDDEAPF